MMKYDSFLGIPTMRRGNDASSAGGRPMRVGVTKIRVARTRIERTMTPRIHTSRSTRGHGAGPHKRSSGDLNSRLIGPEFQEGCDPEQACADNRRQEARAATFEGPVE